MKNSMEQNILKFFVVFLLVVVTMLAPMVTNAASVGPNSPGTIVDEKTVGVGTVEWLNLSNAQTSNNAYATATVDNPAGTGGTKDKSVKLIKGNVISGTEKAYTSYEWFLIDVYASYGGSSDLWGLTLTPADINASDFGLAFSAIGTNSNDNAHTTRYIKATNFGFSIPAGATINGVLADVEKKKDIGATQWANKGIIGVDHIRITVYYTQSQTISCTSLSRDVMSPVVGQSVTVTCQGSFSSSVTSPVARFRVSIDNGTFGTSGTVPLSPAGASYTATVPQPGAYVVQCQICTDSTAATCTTWGAGATSTSCQQSYTVGTPTATPVPPTATPTPDCLKKSQGDTDCDGNVTYKDYFYYVQKISGGSVPTSVSADFNVSGTVDGVDRGIIIHTLLGQ